MSVPRSLRTLTIAAASIAAVGAGVFGVGIALAHSAKPSTRVARQVHEQTLLSIARGHFQISIGTAPEWLPLSNTPEQVTLISGSPSVANPGADTAYVGLGAAKCAAQASGAHGTVVAFGHYYSSSHLATARGDAFAPNGGAARGVYVATSGEFVLHGSARVRACVWLGSSSHSSRLVGTTTLPVLNSSFAASVSNLSSSTGGYTMYAIDGGRSFSYSVRTTQCGTTKTDGSSSVPAGTAGSETVGVSANPCSTDATSVSFSGGHGSLKYPIADALANPPVTVSRGGCELDPLTGVTLSAAERYLTAVGCRLAAVEISPYQKSLPRGSVAWASVDGGLAELAPAKTAVTLVMNGR